MSAATIVSPREELHAIYDREFGFLPDNFSIKPVHIANGLTRSLTGRTYDTTPLARMVRRWVQDRTTKLEQERYPTEGILDAYGEAFDFQGPPDVERINALRALAFGLLSADRGVYDPADRSSFTLSNERFATRDLSDNRAGLFLSRFLTAGHPGAAADLLTEYLTDERDPYTTLALPLLPRDARAEDVRLTDSQAQALDDLLAVDRDGAIVSPVRRQLREAMDRLARFERSEGSKLNSLRRIVLFGCFVLHVHLTSRLAEVVAGGPRPPILLDMFNGARLPLRDASRATLQAAGDVLEALIAQRFKERMQSIDDGAIEPILEGEIAGKLQTRLRASYAAHVADPERSPSDALAEAYLEIGFAATGGPPVGYLTELGRRAGYLTPWANEGRGGRLQKRYGATAEFVETLVASCVEPQEWITFDQLLSRLRDTLGIVVGRPEDDNIIRYANLSEQPWGRAITIAEEDLRLNRDAFRLMIIDTGYAKEYADGQTVVTSTPDSEAEL